MPIDDVDFLLDNCVTDQHIIYIDSAKRDKIAYPHPNHYAIKFSSPYRFVHGIELMDASIPSTMFNIDTHNNVMSYVTSTSTNINTTMQELVQVPGFRNILEYSLVDDVRQAMHEYGTSKPFEVVFLTDETPSSADIFLDAKRLSTFIDNCLTVDIDALNIADDPFDGFNSGTGVLFDPSSTAHLIITKHKVKDVKLYASQQAAHNGDLPIYEVIVDKIKMYTTDAYLYDFYSCFNKKYGNLGFYDIFRVKRPKILRAYSLQQKSCDNYEYEWFYYTISVVSEAEYNGIATNAEAAPVTFLQTIFRPGNYSAKEFLRLNSTFMTDAVLFDEGASSTIELYPNFKIIGEHPFVINQLGTSIGNVIGLGEDANTLWSKNYTYIPNIPYLIGSLSENNENFIDCPGLINFISNRYVVVRCEELEDHMYGSYSYGDFTPGIGVLRLFEVDGVSHQRNDYVNFVKSPFHPIGKLDKITLTFLLPNLSTRYDFKGIDHLMLLSIKFYVPKQLRKLQTSILNPNYNPDFHEYSHQHIDYKGRPNVFVPPIEQNVDEANEIRKIEKEYDYTSSDDGDDLCELDETEPKSGFVDFNT